VLWVATGHTGYLDEEGAGLFMALLSFRQFQTN